ncbi:hypothetical protein IJ182_08630 [bacterium]|nr:hypothetical protein [bacterium]
MAETVKFDPGMGEFVIDFNNYVNDVYSNLLNLHSPHQKRAQFKLYSSKIYSYIQNNIAFYFGCLLWGYYLYFSNQKEPKEIVGNSFLYMTKEEQQEYDFLLQVNFMMNYFDSFERDTGYYLGKKIIISEQWKKILTFYTDFLNLNNGFLNTKLTSDIIIPNEIKAKDIDLTYIHSLIEDSIKNKDLSLLLKQEKIVI